jgi:hypothetical protein
MTIIEKIDSAKSNKYFILFKEGLFYKCYNQNAMVFVCKVKNYKVNLKFVKSVGEDVYSVGFPVSEVKKGSLSVANILEKIGAKGYEENEGNIVFLLNDIGKKQDYETWKKIIQETNIGIVKQPTTQYQQSTYAEVIISMIKKFDLANSTPMQGLGFIQDLQFEVHRLEKNNGNI